MKILSRISAELSRLRILRAQEDDDEDASKQEGDLEESNDYLQEMSEVRPAESERFRW